MRLQLRSKRTQALNSKSWSLNLPPETMIIPIMEIIRNDEYNNNNDNNNSNNKNSSHNNS